MRLSLLSLVPLIGTSFAGRDFSWIPAAGITPGEFEKAIDIFCDVTCDNPLNVALLPDKEVRDDFFKRNAALFIPTGIDTSFRLVDDDDDDEDAVERLVGYAWTRPNDGIPVEPSPEREQLEKEFEELLGDDFDDYLDQVQKRRSWFQEILSEVPVLEDRGWQELVVMVIEEDFDAKFKAGAKLIAEIVKIAPGKPILARWIEVDEPKIITNEFWEKLGFRIIGEGQGADRLGQREFSFPESKENPSTWTEYWMIWPGFLARDQ